jgi:hypothetical protein
VTETSKPHEGLDRPRTAEVSRGAGGRPDRRRGRHMGRAHSHGLRFPPRDRTPGSTASDVNVRPGRIVLWAAVTAVASAASTSP